MIEKLHAATDARASDGFVLVARTDANSSLGLDAAVERANLYLDHGADVVFIEAPKDEVELAAIPGMVEGPVMVNMVEGGATPLLPLDRLAAMGYAVVLYANSGLRAAAKAMQEVLGHLRSDGTTAGVVDRIMPWAERQNLVRKDELVRLADGYARGGGVGTPSPEPGGGR
jgi:2-methylisocitrate lyase-like PEP mutase family enzyme